MQHRIEQLRDLLAHTNLDRKTAIFREISGCLCAILVCSDDMLNETIHDSRVELVEIIIQAKISEEYDEVDADRLLRLVLSTFDDIIQDLRTRKRIMAAII